MTHAHKPLFGKQGKVLDLGNLDFDIVSTVRCPVENFVLRVSDFASPGIFTLVESALQIRLFMQNKANFRKSQMNVNKVLTKDYEKRTLGEHGKNEPKTNPNEPNLSRRSLWRSRIKPKNMLPGSFTPALLFRSRILVSTLWQGISNAETLRHSSIKSNCPCGWRASLTIQQL